MANWITVTPTEPDGGYTDANTDIRMTYAQNTTPSTRAATLEFKNAIAEQKHEYNPDSPDGEVQYKVYQFGRRELRLTVSSSNYSVTTSDTKPPTTYLNAVWDNSQYNQSHSVALDFTTNVGGSGITNQENAESLNRDYYTSNDNAVPGTMTIQITSTSPWFIAEGAEWTGVPAAYYNSSRNSTNYLQPRTFDGSDNATPVSVDIAISPNNGGSARSTTLYVVNKQGYIQTLNLTQKGYVVPNQPPSAAVVSIPQGQCPGTTFTFDASASMDPDGVITDYIWGGSLGSSCGNSSTCTVTFPANSNCVAASTITGAVTLRVRDDRNAESTTRSYDITSLGKVECSNAGIQCNASASDINVGFTDTASITYTTTAAAIPGCQSSPVSITSISSTNGHAGTFTGGSGSWSGTAAQNGITISGDSTTVTMNAQDGNGATCSVTTTVTYGEGNKTPAPTITFIGDGQVNGANGVVTATCSPNDPDNTGPYTYSWSGDFSGSNSTSTATYTGLTPGNSITYNASCTVTDSGNPPKSGTGNNTATVTRQNITYDCNGYQNCVQVAGSGGEFATLAACQASSCYRLEYVINAAATKSIGTVTTCPNAVLPVQPNVETWAYEFGQPQFLGTSNYPWAAFVSINGVHGIVASEVTTTIEEVSGSGFNITNTSQPPIVTSNTFFIAAGFSDYGPGSGVRQVRFTINLGASSGLDPIVFGPNEGYELSYFQCNSSQQSSCTGGCGCLNRGCHNWNGGPYNYTVNVVSTAPDNAYTTTIPSDSNVQWTGSGGTTQTITKGTPYTTCSSFMPATATFLGADASDFPIVFGGNLGGSFISNVLTVDIGSSC